MRYLIVLSLFFSLSVSGQPVSGAGAFQLGEKQIEEYKQEALAGSMGKARRLYEYYQMTEMNDSEARRWLIICAENGEPICQYNFGFILNQEKESQRAMFWLRRAYEEGANKAAKDLLEEIDRKASRAKRS